LQFSDRGTVQCVNNNVPPSYFRWCYVPIIFGRRYLLTFLVFSLAFAITSPSTVSADPCSVQLGFPIIPAVYANTIVTVVVPISATCSASYGNQLYASANAYDLNADIAVDSVNTVLTSVNGGYAFTGQLGFNLPASTQGHWVQVSVSVFSGQAGSPLTTTGEAFQVNAQTVQVVTTTVFPQTSLQPAPSQPATSQLAPSSQETYSDPRFIFAYVAIATLVAVVIIVTVGLIVYSQRPGSYPPSPRG